MRDHHRSQHQESVHHSELCQVRHGRADLPCAVPLHAKRHVLVLGLWLQRAQDLRERPERRILQHSISVVEVSVAGQDVRVHPNVVVYGLCSVDFLCNKHPDPIPHTLQQHSVSPCSQSCLCESAVSGRSQGLCLAWAFERLWVFFAVFQENFLRLNAGSCRALRPFCLHIRLQTAPAFQFYIGSSCLTREWNVGFRTECSIPVKVFCNVRPTVNVPICCLDSIMQESE
mmetsp:Transcript_22271/g.52659  ORF Transcript_22271/g.52659 Transcript_22271/m.52659 type:complete len:229 (+) Transcript_22271:194-880(+)